MLSFIDQRDADYNNNRRTPGTLFDPMRPLALLAALFLLWPAPPGRAATPRLDLLEARSLAMGGALRTLAGPVAAARIKKS